MANYNKDYNLEERLKRNRAKEEKKSSSAANSSGSNSKNGVKSNAFKDDIYNLQERLYGHKDRSVAVANGSERRVNQLNNAYQPLYKNMYRAGASIDGTFDDSIDKLFQKTGQALQYYKMYPGEFGDRLEPARELDTNTYNSLLDLKKGPIAARYGNASVLDGLDPKSDQYRQYKALLNLAGYDVQAPGLLKQNNAKNFEEMVEISKNFNLQDALLTVEDYYRMINSPVMADGLSAANVDKADYDKAADDILTFTGIDVRDLTPDKVQGVLEQVGGMKDTVDYMQSYYRTQDRWNQEQQKQTEYNDFVSKSYAEASADPEFAALSQFDEAETSPLYKAVMLPQGSKEQQQAVTDLGYDWNMRVNGIMPLLGRDTEDSYGFEFMSPQQREEFAYRWKKNGSGDALQYLNDISWGVNKQRMEAEIQQSQEFADDGFWKGAAASADSVARNFAGEIEGLYNIGRKAFGFDVNEYDPGFLNTVKGQTERQTVGQNISENTQKLNLFGKNVPQMAYNALMSAADSTLNAMTLGGAASPMMGAGAFNASFQQKLEEGMPDQDAFIDALVEGGIETGTEYFSIDALMKDSTSPLGYFLRNLITEPTEEITGFAATEIYDNLKNGADSRVNKRIDELRTMGYTTEDAKAQATREMLADLFETGFTAFLSGGVAATGGTIQTAVANQTSGKNIQSHGNEAVKSMLDLANTFHFDEDVQSLIDEQSAILNDPNGKGGVLSPAKIGRIFRETMKAVDENAQQTVQNVTARYVAGELQKNGVDDPEMTDAVVRIVADNGSAKAEDYQRVTASRGAIAVVEGLTGSIDNARNLSQKAARIAEQAAKKNKNTTTEETTEVVPEVVGETDELPEEELAAAEIPTDAEAISTMIRGEVQDLGEQNAESVVSAYQEGQDPVSYATQFKRAMQFGEEGRNLDIIKKSDSLSALTDYQKTKAYTMGRGMRVARAEEAAKNRKGLVKVGNIDTSAIRNVKLNNAQRSSVRAISKLAQAVGFNVRFIDSATNAQGEFTEENGKWQKSTRTITIDVNAGRLSKDSTNYAMMQTAGHELTHFIKEFADVELFAAYQDFVFGHLSEKMTEAELDSKISGMIADYKTQNVELDRDGAIEEIVAEASGDALLKMTQEDFNELSQSNPTLMQKIGEFFKRWVGDIKALIQKAYSGQTARNEIAEQMLDAVDELGKRWNELLKNAAASARETAVQQTESATKVKKNQPVEAGRFLTYNHIDQRTPETIRSVDSQLFSSEVEEAQVGFAAAAQMLLADVDASISGQKFFADDGVTGQKRMTSDFLGSMKDSTGWTWDKIKASLQQFADMADGETMPKNTVTNREMELYLDEVLSGGYTTIDGQKVAPWDEYIEAKEQYQGSRGEKAPQSAYDGSIDFVEYAFADSGDKYSLRDYAPEQKVNWSGSNSIVVYSDKQQALQFIEEARTNKAMNKKLYFGMVPKALAQRIMIEADYDKDLTGFNVRIHANEIRKIFKDHGDPVTEAKRGQRAIIPEDIVQIPFTVEHADTIARSDSGYRGLDAFVFTKTIDGSRVRIIGAVGSGKMDLFVQTMYAGQKKQSLAGGADEQASANTPKATHGTAPNKSIAEGGGDVKFSMRRLVEQSKNLVAIHNIREDNLRKALDLGGFPMPSIAIAKRDIGHQNFGSISLVFSSDTIDPKANKRNKVYSADAWTPTFPQVEYEVDKKADTRVYNKLTSLKRAVDQYFADDLNRMAYGVEDQLNRYGGEEGLVQRALDNYGMKAAYLEESGQHIEPVTRTEVEEMNFSEKRVEIYTQIADLVGIEDIRKKPLREIFAQYGDAINEIYPGSTGSRIRFARILGNVSDYYKNKDAAPVTKTVTDPAATRELIDDSIDSAAYERWVRDLYRGIEGASGVYNGKEIFTPSGNRRSFAATHYPVTVEGIAKAMYDAYGGNVKNISSNHDAKSLRAVASKSFKSIDEMHKNEGRLRARTQEEADALTESLNVKLNDLAGEVLATKPKSRDTYESLMAHEQVASILEEIASKKYSAASIKAGYAQYGYNISDATAESLNDLLNEISAMPVNIFEAKPERAVYFDEVKYAIVPDTLDADVRSRLEAVVPDVREYTDGDEAQRLELLNAREDLMFQLRDPSQITDREILANVMESAAKNEAELDFVRRYRKRIASLNEKQAALEETNAAIVNARKAGKRADAAALQNKADILAKQIAREDGALLKFEAGKPLQAVVQRERAALKRKADERVKAYAAKRVETVKKQEAEKRERLNQKLAEVREKRDQKLKELRKEKTEAVERMRDEKNESFGRQKYLKQVNEATAKLRTMVTTPTNKEHVPQFLRKPLGEFLDALDFTSKRQLEGGDPTNADVRLADAAAALRNAIGKISKQQSGLDTSGEEFFNGYLDIPSNYIEEFDLLMTKVRAAIKAASGLDDTPINKMKSSDLHDLAVCLRTLQISINKMNRLLSNAQFAHADDASRTTISELDKFKAKKEQSKLMQKAMDFFDWKNTVPYYAFKRFGKGGQAIFESLQNGWDKLAFHAGKLVEFTKTAYKVEEVREWDKQIKQVKLTSGETVSLTTSQLMSLYCLAKREQALGHMMGGGIRIATIDGKRGKSVVQGENYILSEADIDTFRKQLTDRQREVADTLQQDMVKRGAEWGNEISMKRFGYEMFTEENYFPVESDRNNMSAKDPGAQENSLLRLLNMSATKDLTRGANNAIVVRSIFDVYTAHMSDMAKYNALALPILDAMKWLNYVERTQDDNGKITTRSVQKSLELTYGEEARRYIMEFIKNLNGETEGGRDEIGIGKLTSNYKIAAVGANLRVGLLQITSLPRAMTVINPKFLLSGIAKWNTRKGMSKTAMNKVGIAKWKSMGFYDTNISRNMRQMIKHDESAIDKTRNWSMKFAEWGDAWTMGVLYGAVESELVQRMTPGTEAFDKAVNERMREIIYRTQVVDSTMTRSHLMRQKHVSGLMSFMSEPTLAMNMLNDTLFDLRMNSRSTDGTKWNPAASKTLAKVMGVSVLTTAAASVIEALFTAYRDDDEYEEFGEKFLEAWVGDFTDAEKFTDYWKAFWEGSVGSNINPFGGVPIISDMVDALKNGAAKQMWQEFLGDLGSGFPALIRAIRNDGSLADIYGASYKILNGFSKLVGVPMSAAVRELVAFYNTIVAEPMGWRRLQTYDNSKSEAAASVLSALTEGDTDKAASIRERAALYGIEEKDLNESLATRVNTAYLKGKVDRDTAESLLTEQAGKRGRQADKVLTKSDYQLETGLKHSEMKDNFISGTITEQKAREYLKTYDGLRKDEIDAKIGEWEYEKETGLSYGSMKEDFIDGVLTESQVKNYRMEYGDADEDAVQETLGHWKYERDTGLAYSEMKLDYADGIITESQARSYLAKYGMKDEEEVEEKISNFDYYVATGRTTSAPKYWRIAYAFDSGANYQFYIDEAFDQIQFGGEKRKSWKQARSQIASSLASYYKAQYLAAIGTAAGDAMLERILDLYEAIGYPRSYQREYIAENWIEDD